MTYGYCPCGAMLLENGCEECEHRTDGRDCLCDHCNPVTCPCCKRKRPHTTESYKCEGCGHTIAIFAGKYRLPPLLPSFVGYQ